MRGRWISRRTWVRHAVLLPAVAGAVLAASSSAAGARPPAEQRLSDETTFTRWAHVARRRPIYRRPAASAARVGRLRRSTEDGFPEIYLLLRAHRDEQGEEWVRLRIPARPNGQTGWVRRSSLGAFHLTHTLVVVNRGRRRMSFYSKGRKLWSAPVGVGKPGTPTPRGRFWVRERFKILDPSSGYYPYAFGTSAYSVLSEWPGGGVVGIHGPYHESRRIPGPISHGCIRLRVRDTFWLAAHVRLGTPVHVF
jgi:hypothetical protein